MSLALLVGSVIGVIGLAAIAWMLGLGGGTIASADEARRIAEEALGGFAAEEAIVSSDGSAALVRGRDDAIALLKVHGAHIAARRLVGPVEVELGDEGVTIRSGERMFGDVRLRLAREARDKLLTMV